MLYQPTTGQDIIYTAPVPTDKDDLETIEDIKEHPNADAAVKHNIPVGERSNVHHTAEYLYVPSTTEDADGKYAVFTTNRDDIDTDEIEPICNSYSRRWDIENRTSRSKSSYRGLLRWTIAFGSRASCCPRCSTTCGDSPTI